MNIVSTAVHRRVPNLPVSPSRSPSSASLSVGAAHADCMLWDAEETTTTDLYDAYRDEAGSNLAAGLRGPKIGVHLRQRYADAAHDKEQRLLQLRRRGDRQLRLEWQRREPY